MSVADLQAQLDAANQGFWEMERKLNAALMVLQEIADSHIPSQPIAMDYSDLVWAQRHVGTLRGLAVRAIREARE